MIKLLDENQSAYLEMNFWINNSVSVYCNPTASKQNMEKLSISISFIAGVIDTSD
jgi:hypothetical protein